MWRVSKPALAITAIGIVAAVLAPAVVSADIIRSEICAPFSNPMITAPAATTTTSDSSVHITGTGQIGLSLKVYRNNTSSGVTTVASDGSFGVQIPLSSGTNTIVAQQTDSCSTVKASQDLVVYKQVIAPVVTPDSTTTDSGNKPSSAATQQAQTTSTPTASIPTAGIPSLAVADIIKPKPAEADLSDVPDSQLTPAETKARQQVITQPKPGSTIGSDRVWVAGLASPLSIVDIYINRVNVAKVVADDQGSYGVLVDVADGDNSIHVRATSQEGVVTTRTIAIQLDKNLAAPASAKPEDTPKETVLFVVVGTIGVGVLTLTGIIAWHSHTLAQQMKLQARKNRHA